MNIFSECFFNHTWTCVAASVQHYRIGITHESVPEGVSEQRIAAELRLEGWTLQTGAGEAGSAGPGSLYQRPAGKLSVAAELPWADSGTGRDGDDKVHRLKWFSSEAQLRDSDIKAHAASFSLHVLHTHPSLAPRHVKDSQTALAVVERVCGPLSVFYNPCFSLFYCLWPSPCPVHLGCEVRNYLHVGTLTTSVLYQERNKSGVRCLFCWVLSDRCCEWDVRGQVLSMRSPCPEPHSTNSISPLEWGGLSREMPRRSPNTFSCSSMMSLRMSAIISRRKSKEPGGPWGQIEELIKMPCMLFFTIFDSQ